MAQYVLCVYRTVLNAFSQLYPDRDGVRQHSYRPGLDSPPTSRRRFELHFFSGSIQFFLWIVCFKQCPSIVKGSAVQVPTGELRGQLGVPFCYEVARPHHASHSDAIRRRPKARRLCSFQPLAAPSQPARRRRRSRRCSTSRRGATPTSTRWRRRRATRWRCWCGRLRTWAGPSRRAECLYPSPSASSLPSPPLFPPSPTSTPLSARPV